MNKTVSCEAAADSLLAGFMNVGGGLNSYVTIQEQKRKE